MITKLILTSTLAVAMTHGSVDGTLFTDADAPMNETTKQAVWNPTIAKKASGASCDDGNCITDLNCMTKDGKAYKFITSLRDKIKKQCKKL